VDLDGHPEQVDQSYHPGLSLACGQPLWRDNAHPVGLVINSEHADSGPRDATACRRGQILHIGNEANKWEEQYFLGPDDEAEPFGSHIAEPVQS
jgi:hypothetical protein